MSTTLLVANDGGHLAQLSTLAGRLTDVSARIWVTPPTAQSKSLLAGEDVFWVDEAPTRDWRAVCRNAVEIRRLLRTVRIERAVSTGSSLALSALPQAALRRVPAHYIESVTRSTDYSLTGRILQRTPGISLYAQWSRLETSRWMYAGSVLDGFVSATSAATPVRKLVVSLGTSGRYGFRRLLEHLRAVVPADVDVFWQTGSTDVTGLGIDARPSVPSRELSAALAEADVVVAHAGAGIALSVLQAGKIPILAPRLAALGEHIDDHQSEIAARLDELNLAVVRDPAEITWATLELMTSRRAVVADTVPSFRLREERRLLR